MPRLQATAGKPPPQLLCNPGFQVLKECACLERNENPFVSRKPLCPPGRRGEGRTPWGWECTGLQPWDRAG